MLRPEKKDDSEDIVRCDMFTCPLRNPPPYIVLSYVWGDLSDTRKILMGRADITMRVSASLESTLRALRDPRKSILVWADAISINKHDPSEKAEQVRLMTRIYQKADLVAIWLGPRSGDSDLGMELIREVSNGAAITHEITERTPAPFSEKKFAAVVALFDRAYWHRLWVVQEVFNARDIDVTAGRRCSRGKHFKSHRKYSERKRTCSNEDLTMDTAMTTIKPDSKATHRSWSMEAQAASLELVLGLTSGTGPTSPTAWCSNICSK